MQAKSQDEQVDNESRTVDNYTQLFNKGQFEWTRYLGLVHVRNLINRGVLQAITI